MAVAAEHEIVHATAIAASGRAALIRGPSGSGKSDLALRCIAAAPSALLPDSVLLVSDDQVRLERVASRLLASAPVTIRGKLEVHGQGIVTLPASEAAEVALVVDLTTRDKIERYPLVAQSTSLLGVEVPLLRLAPFEASAAIKLLLALGRSTAAVEHGEPP